MRITVKEDSMKTTRNKIEDKMNEIYVAVKQKEYVEGKIAALCDKYNNRLGLDYNQKRALLKSLCYDTTSLFRDCFETSMLGMKRCITRVEAYQSKDNVDIDAAVLDIVEMLWTLKDMVSTMVPIKDLPSCKKLTEMSPADIISKAKDLVKSDVIKASVSALILGSKISDVISIEDVKSYYNDRLSRLTEEIKIKNGESCPVELFLLDKFNAEIGYCNIALLKAGVGITEELKALVEIGRTHIEKYENNIQKYSGAYVG